MIPTSFQKSGTVAVAEVTVHCSNHQIETEKGKMMWTGAGKGPEIEIGTEIELMIQKVYGEGTERKVEAEKVMIMTRIEAERETGIGESA